MISPEDLKTAKTDRSPRMLTLITYFLSSVCRRDSILNLFGIDDQVCSGCDVCDGTDERGPHAFKAMCRWFLEMRGSITRHNIIHLLMPFSDVKRSMPLIASPPYQVFRKTQAEETVLNLNLIIGVMRSVRRHFYRFFHSPDYLFLANKLLKKIMQR